MPNTIDYLNDFPGAIMAEGRGKNVLILYKLDQPTNPKFLDVKCHYETVHRFLSKECYSENDQAWACVESQESTLWEETEIDLNKGLMDQFNLF